MKVFLSICLVAACCIVINPALASEILCEEPKVSINTGSYTSPEQAINLESEIVKLSKVLCQEGLEIYYEMASNLSIDFVNRKTAFCGTLHSEPDPNGKSKTTLLIDNRYVWSAADLSRCFVNILEGAKFLSTGGDQKNTCSIAQLAVKKVDFYSDIYEGFKLIYPDDALNMETFASHAMHMQTNKIDLEILCNDFKDRRRPPKKSGLEI